MNRTGKWFWALVAVQVLFLLGWAGYHEYLRSHAPVMLLKSRPVDPQDLLRGDYMIMRYDISDVDQPGVPGRPFVTSPAGFDVWVLLERTGRYFEVVKTSPEKLHPQAGQVLVRGTARYSWVSDNAYVQIDYGIEKYFVPEGKGTPRFNLMEVEVTVSPVHRLAIKQVLLDGKAFP